MEGGNESQNILQIVPAMSPKKQLYMDDSSAQVDEGRWWEAKTPNVAVPTGLTIHLLDQSANATCYDKDLLEQSTDLVHDFHSLVGRSTQYVFIPINIIYIYLQHLLSTFAKSCYHPYLVLIPHLIFLLSVSLSSPSFRSQHLPNLPQLTMMILIIDSYEGTNMSMVAHPANTLTLSAGLQGRGGHWDISLSGAEYDWCQPTISFRCAAYFVAPYIPLGLWDMS